MGLSFVNPWSRSYKISLGSFEHAIDSDKRIVTFSRGMHIKENGKAIVKLKAYFDVDLEKKLTVNVSSVR